METIKKLRETIGMSKTLLARHAGLHNSRYTDIENQKYILNHDAEIEWKIRILSAMASHIKTIKQLEPEILTAIEKLKNEIK